MCPVILNSTCVFYEGNTLIYTGITTNDSLQTALQKIDAKFGDAMVGYTFTNGVNQPSAGAPVGLGGSLTANTSIGGNFTLTFAGNLQATKHITIGGTASQFVKGDGTLDSTAYQAAGNYITALTGDVIAAGPGSVNASLAVVNSNPGTYGSGTRIPIVTVDTKGRVTALTTTAINVPSGVLSFVGDVFGSGTTGSPTTLTLTNVNTNVYTNNTFLKFKVNAKGLVTGATPVTNLDIEGILGYVPVPETRTITINGITKNLQTNVIFTLPGGGTVQSVSVTAGTGIAASVANPTINPNITITNTAPDQVVSITGQSGIDVTGTYPNFTISANEEGAVTSVTASAPLASSGGQTPNITISQASASANGYLSSTDWNTFNNKQNAIPYTPADDALVVHKAGTETITGQKTFDLSPITQVGLLLKNQSVTPYATGYSGISADGGNFSLIKDNGVHAQLDLTNLTVNREYVFPDANGTLTLLSDLAAYQPLLNGTGLVRMAGTTVTYDNTSYTPQARTLTINGTTYDLTANRSWSIDSMVYPSAGIAVSTGTAWGTSIVDNSANWNTAYSLRITSATAPLNITGTTISISQAGASANGFLSSTDWNTFNNKQASGNYITDLTGEATATGPGSATVTLNNAAVTGKILTGVNITGGTVVATDSILQAFGKVQNQINGLIGGTVYQGVWNAATNTPTLTSGVGTDGHYYITNVAGNTNLDGITDWHVGDWAIFHDGVWQQVDNTDAVVSVNGFTGAVSLVTTDIPEGTNLYFTPLRARQAISLTTTGTSGAATYNDTTGVLNIPQYQGGVISFNTRTGAITLTSLDVTNALTYTPVTEARTLTINGTTYDLTANRTWSIDSMIYPAAGIAVSTGTAWAASITDNSTNWNTAYTLRISSLTTTGSSGAATLASNVLNIPNYTLSGLGGVPSTRTITINSTAYDLSSDRTWDVGTVTSVAALTIGTTGTDITSSVATGTTTPVITLNIPTASATNRGALSSTDWTTFNNKLSPATAASTYVPYSGATSAVNLGIYALFTSGTYITKSGTQTGAVFFEHASGGSLASLGYSAIGISGTDGILMSFNGGSNTITLKNNLLSAARAYSLPNASGTIALTSDLSSYVPTTRTLTINGTAYDLSADRSWTIASSGGTVTSVAALTIGTTGTDITSTVANSTTTPVITLNIPTASATNRGALSAADWSTFNGKQAALSGTGFVKISGTTISYVDETYLQLIGGTVTGNVNFTSTTTHTGNATFGVGSPTAIDGSDGRIITNKFRLYSTTPATIYSDFVTAATSNRTITIPDASGTIALTSNLSAYLPLAGGTLTGALSGTSATFSNNVIVNGSSIDINPSSGTPNITIRSGNTFRGYIEGNSAGGMSFGTGASAAICLTLASTGAATFSSSVTTTGALTMSAYSFADSALQFRRANTNTVSPGGGNGILVFAGGNAQMRIGTANDINFDVNDGGTPYTVLKLQQNGNTVIVNSSNNSLPLGIAFNGTIHGYIGGASSALYAYSVNNGYVLLNSSSAWVAASDRKRKRNFEQYNLGLNEILGLEPSLYNMDFQKDGDEKQVGLIAQEVKEHIPLAYEENGKFIGLNYNAIIVTMVNAIKELKAELDTLKNK
jgi:predicted heme/steroid binding protein